MTAATAARVFKAALSGLNPIAIATAIPTSGKYRNRSARGQW